MEGQFCQLCNMQLLEDDSYFKLEGIKKDMLEIVVPNIILPNTSLQFICFRCLKVLQILFNFKTLCLENEDFLQNFVNSENVKIDLRNVVQRQIKLENERPNKCEDGKSCICRVCFQENRIVNNSKKMYFIYKENILKCLLEQYLPELGLDLTDDPVICTECLDLLNECKTFTEQCLNSQKSVLPKNQHPPSNQATSNDINISLNINVTGVVCDTTIAENIKMTHDTSITCDTNVQSDLPNQTCSSKSKSLQIRSPSGIKSTVTVSHHLNNHPVSESNADKEVSDISGSPGSLIPNNLSKVAREIIVRSPKDLVIKNKVIYRKVIISPDAPAKEGGTSSSMKTRARRRRKKSISCDINDTTEQNTAPDKTADHSDKEGNSSRNVLPNGIDTTQINNVVAQPQTVILFGNEGSDICSSSRKVLPNTVKPSHVGIIGRPRKSTTDSKTIRGPYKKLLPKTATAPIDSDKQTKEITDASLKNNVLPPGNTLTDNLNILSNNPTIQSNIFTPAQIFTGTNPLMQTSFTPQQNLSMIGASNVILTNGIQYAPQLSLPQLSLSFQSQNNYCSPNAFLLNNTGISGDIVPQFPLVSNSMVAKEIIGTCPQSANNISCDIAVSLPQNSTANNVVVKSSIKVAIPKLISINNVKENNLCRSQRKRRLIPSEENCEKSDKRKIEATGEKVPKILDKSSDVIGESVRKVLEENDNPNVESKIQNVRSEDVIINCDDIKNDCEETDVDKNDVIDLTDDNDTDNEHSIYMSPSPQSIPPPPKLTLQSMSYRPNLLPIPKMPHLEKMLLLPNISPSKKIPAPPKMPPPPNIPPLRNMTPPETNPPSQNIPSSQDMSTSQEMPTSQKIPTSEDKLPLQNQPSSQEMPSPQNVQPVSNKSNFKWSCKLCQFKTREKSQYLRHECIHNSLGGELSYRPPRNSRKSNIKQRVKKSPGKPKIPLLVCKKCTFSTFFKWCFDDHKCSKVTGVKTREKSKHSENQTVQISLDDVKDIQSSNPKKNVNHRDNQSPVKPLKQPAKSEHVCEKCLFSTPFKWVFDSHNCPKHSLTREAPKKIYQCKLCGWLCDAKIHVRCHSAIHFINTRCEKCNYTGRDDKYLHVHFYRKHLAVLKLKPSNKSRKCLFCGRKYSSLTQLHEHLKTEHAEEKLYFCNICDFVGYELTDMYVHMRDSRCRKSSHCNDCKGKKSFLLNHLIKEHTTCNKPSPTLDLKPSEVSNESVIETEELKCVSLCDKETNQKVIDSEPCTDTETS